MADTRVVRLLGEQVAFAQQAFVDAASEVVVAGTPDAEKTAVLRLRVASARLQFARETLAAVVKAGMRRRG